MPIQSLNLPEFAKLKTAIESRRRSNGYYLIELVSIQKFVEKHLLREELLQMVFQHFDDQEWPPTTLQQPDQSWEADYRVSRDEAIKELTTALVGGKEVGHLKETISPDLALDYIHRFEGFFSGEIAYYARLGLGKSDYVFFQGVVMLDDSRAGILYVVEND